MGTNKMKIAVLSGKGGTGKTLLSVNLAAAAGQSVYIDCDVEEPNGHLFFKPDIRFTEEVTVKIPEVDMSLCDGCRKCVDFCMFSALAYTKNKLIIFEDICHSCGGCVMLCPKKAFTEKNKVIGQITMGQSEDVTVWTGMMNTGEVSGVPIIDRLLEKTQKNEDIITFIDSPPGSACTAMESIKDVDYAVLVAEPTLFGAHNLEMVYELVKLFNKPFGVVLNKSMGGKNPSRDFCAEKNIEILQNIPYDNVLGSLNSNGEIAVRKSEKYNKIFSDLLNRIKGEVHRETASYIKR